MPDDAKSIQSEAATLVPGIDLSVIVGCGDARQITLRTMVLQDTPIADAHALTDKLMAIGDRQRARYDLDAETEGMEKVATTLTAMIVGLPIAHANFIAAQEKRVEELRGYEAEYTKLHDEGYAEHVASKRSADTFKPQGGRKANMERMVQAGAKVKAAIEAAKSEAAQLFETNMKSVEHYREDLGRRREKVNGLRRLAGIANDVPQFECETCALPTDIEA